MARFKLGAWGFVIGSVLTMIVGFGWGGWMTRSGADRVAFERSQSAVTVALVPACLEKSKADPASAKKLGALRTLTSSWDQRDAVVQAGWASIGDGEPNREVADACASQLLKSRRSSRRVFAAREVALRAEYARSAASSALLLRCARLRLARLLATAGLPRLRLTGFVRHQRSPPSPYNPCDAVPHQAVVNFGRGDGAEGSEGRSTTTHAQARWRRRQGDIVPVLQCSAWPTKE